MKADGNVEVWLTSLMKMAHFSLHCVIRTAAMAIQDSNFQLLEFLNMFPAQVIITVHAEYFVTFAAKINYSNICSNVAVS